MRLDPLLEPLGLEHICHRAQVFGIGNGMFGWTPVKSGKEGFSDSPILYRVGQGAREAEPFFMGPAMVY